MQHGACISNSTRHTVLYAVPLCAEVRPQLVPPASWPLGASRSHDHSVVNIAPPNTLHAAGSHECRLLPSSVRKGVQRCQQVGSNKVATPPALGPQPANPATAAGSRPCESPELIVQFPEFASVYPHVASMQDTPSDSISQLIAVPAPTRTPRLLSTSVRDFGNAAGREKNKSRLRLSKGVKRGLTQNGRERGDEGGSACGDLFLC